MTTHYTYLITNFNPASSERYYIGVRTCNCSSEDDFAYMGSSATLADIIKENGIDNFEKVIIEEWESRNKATAHEVWLHAEYDVVINNQFYNKAKALNNGFTTYGNKNVVEKYKKTVSDPTWKETIGREKIKKQQKTKSNPKWKETKGIASVNKMLHTRHSEEWSTSTGRERSRKYKATVNDSVWKDTAGKEAVRKRRKTINELGTQQCINEKIVETVNDSVWKDTKGKERSKRQREKYNDLAWVNSVGKTMRQNQIATINNPAWKETKGKEQIRKRKETITDPNWVKENTFICSHCGSSVAGRGNFNRWHNDNCKQKD